MATAAEEEGSGVEAIHFLKAVEPPRWLAPSADLSAVARLASRHLFSQLNPFCPKSPFDRLLVDGFDAEQIWQQIDLQSQPLLAALRREVRRFEKNPEEISSIFGESKREESKRESEEGGDLAAGDEAMEEIDEEGDDFDDAEEEEEEEEEEEKEEEVEGEGGGIEDKFLKIKKMQEFLEDGEAEEYGLKKKEKAGKKASDEEEDGDREDEAEDDEEEDDDQLGLYGVVDDEDEGSDDLGNARYDEFFGTKKNRNSNKRPKNDRSDDLGTDEEPADDKNFETLSTHEKEREKIRAKIEQMEKASLEQKHWTLQGEVTASKRPKNSALEVDLDFEHNVRPPPVITEEVTASIEDLIRARILEGRFDDVQKAPALPSKAPKELKEVDENKSKKGLAEVYEEEYAQKTGLSSGPLSFADEQKKEASMLFKKLCLKLDALSHFHFSPKPVIEDMSIQANLPALAMEEIAPATVSDAAMLAPEEVFAGKGDIKEETELTKEDRKRRRAKIKRRFKSERAKMRMEQKPQASAVLNNKAGKDS